MSDMVIIITQKTREGRFAFHSVETESKFYVSMYLMWGHFYFLIYKGGGLTPPFFEHTLLIILFQLFQFLFLFRNQTNKAGFVSVPSGSDRRTCFGSFGF